jgi:hypothetical protein
MGGHVSATSPRGLRLAKTAELRQFRRSLRSRAAYPYSIVSFGSPHLRQHIDIIGGDMAILVFVTPAAET